MYTERDRRVMNRMLDFNGVEGEGSAGDFSARRPREKKGERRSMMENRRAPGRRQPVMGFAILMAAAAAAAVLFTGTGEAYAYSSIIGADTGFMYSGWPSFYGGQVNRFVLSQDVYAGDDFCEECSLRFQASFRVQGDPGVTGSDISKYPILRPQQFSPMLQYAYVDWRPFKPLQIIAGRMLTYDPDTFMTMDGAGVRYKYYRDLGVEAFFGMAVRDGWPLGYQSPAFDAPFDPHPPMTLVRAGLFADGGQGFAGRLQYRRAFDGQVEREDVFGTLSIDALRYVILGGSVEYSILLGQLDYGMADIAVPIKNYTAKLSYTYKVPVFTGSSIFNYFGAYPYNEFRMGLAWASGAWKAVEGYYYFRVLSVSASNAFDNGAEVVLKGNLSKIVAGGISLDYSDGYGGTRAAGALDLSFTATKALDLKLEGGGSKFADPLNQGFEGWAAWCGAGANIAVGNGMAVALDLNGSWSTLYGWQALTNMTFMSDFRVGRR